MSKEFNDFFKPLSPYNLLIDSDNGTFNRMFSPSKDTLLGLDSLFTA
ncbi:MAG: hypothetical protein [Bacteriophage sp.]|nr:MAG: hypothetical protein [Bacteriophage sp.]